MEEDEEKSDDTADYYGSRLSRNRTEESWKVYGGFMANMADIENKARELAELIINGEVYKRYLAAKEVMLQQPELKNRADEFRKRNFEMHGMECGNPSEARTNLMREFSDVLKNSVVKEYLDSEIVLCRMLQQVNKIVNKDIDVDISFM